MVEELALFFFFFIFFLLSDSLSSYPSWNCERLPWNYLTKKRGFGFVRPCNWRWIRTVNDEQYLQPGRQFSTSLIGSSWCSFTFSLFQKHASRVSIERYHSNCMSFSDVEWSCINFSHFLPANRSFSFPLFHFSVSNRRFSSQHSKWPVQPNQTKIHNIRPYLLTNNFSRHLIMYQTLRLEMDGHFHCIWTNQ